MNREELKRQRDRRDDRETILGEVAHIPDRDQFFHDPRDVSHAAQAEAERGAWSGDLEGEVTGETHDEEARGEGVDDEMRTATGTSVNGDAGAVQGANGQGRRANGRSKAHAPRSSDSLVAIDLAQIARSLAERRHDLELMLSAHEAYVKEQLAPTDAGESTVDFNHPADMVQSDPDYERELKLLGQERAELALVTQALARVKEGRFGVCERCDRDIPAQRLFVMPHARYCVACQAKSERH